MKKYLELFTEGFPSDIAEKTAIENKPYVAYSIKDSKVAYTIVPNDDKTMYTIYRVVKKDISNLEYNAVDLGLPSGLKWADRNIGATTPEEYGSYFQWGDTEGFTCEMEGKMSADELAELFQLLFGDEMEITADNLHDVLNMYFEEYLEDYGLDDIGYDLRKLGLCVSLDKSFGEWDNYKYCNGDNYSLTKYNTDTAKGIVDNKTVLDLEDDAAYTHMGSEWRMPTKEDIEELINNTTLRIVDMQDNEYSIEDMSDLDLYTNMKGMYFIGENGNSIFIPASTYLSEGNFVSGLQISATTWGSTLITDLPSSGEQYNNLMGGSLYGRYDGRVSYGNDYRCYGLAVRGVKA